MNMVEQQDLMMQAEYARKLRPLLPPEAFIPDSNKVWILLINLMILIGGWAIASYLDHWTWYYLWLYLPIAIVMGNSIAVLGFSSHNLLHSSVINSYKLRQAISLFGFAMLWMSPTLWKAVHNREHHNKTNSEQDPDRNYLYSQPNTWGKWLQNVFLPSSEVKPILCVIGLGHIWGMYVFRHLTSILFFNNRAATYPVAAFSVSEKDRMAIAWETLVIMGIHLSVLASLHFSPLKILFGYFLPIWIGYAIAIFYILTHHLVCRMTDVNDVLINTISIRVPKIFDILHVNFSYHTEHHIFPGMNPDYYPMVQKLLLTHYPERFNLINADEAWKLLLQTPRHYLNETTFTDWTGTKLVPCPTLGVTVSK